MQVNENYKELLYAHLPTYGIWMRHPFPCFKDGTRRELTTTLKKRNRFKN